MSPLRFLGILGRLSSSSSSRRRITDGVRGFGFSGSAVPAVGALSALAGGSFLYSNKDAQEEEEPEEELEKAPTLIDYEKDVKVAVRITDDEEAMRRRFREWMAKNKRKYKDKQEEAWRYELYKVRALYADEMNELVRLSPPFARADPNCFADFTELESPRGFRPNLIKDSDPTSSSTTLLP